MKTIYIAIILGIIIAASAVFAMAIQPESPLVRKGILPFPQEDYHIKVTGMKDVYLVGEPYSFGYTISGYGYPCGDIQVVYPGMSGDTTFENSYRDCDDNQSMHKFTYTATDKTGTAPAIFGHDGIANPGAFMVGVVYEHGGGIEPAQGGKQFHVVEKICNAGSDKQNAECLAESYDTCESAYMTQQFLAENGGGKVSLKATVDSWHDCQLTVYPENSSGGHTPFNGIRSVCDDMTVNENSLDFENCSNAEYPPIMFNLQPSEPEPVCGPGTALQNGNCVIVTEHKEDELTQKTNYFDSDKYYEEFGPGSPLIYLDTSKPVLNYDNCDRYVYWLTEHQKNDINRYDEKERYPPWGNQIFPLVDYCVANGDLVKTIVDDKIQWEFQLENEN